jgi:hypothetical protein
MHIFVTDDCNDSWDEKMDFFLYGGLAIPESEARSFAVQLNKIKKSNNVDIKRPIKWTNNGWHGDPPLDTEIHASIKEEVLQLVAGSESKIIVCASPQYFFHQSSSKEGKEKMVIDQAALQRTQEYGLNDALKKFNSFLRANEDLGFVIADKFVTSIKNHMDSHCQTLFPGTFPVSDLIIHSVVQINNEDSALLQINDVVLGAIYFSLREMEQNFLPKIKDNFWMSASEDYASIIGKGFTVFPLIPKYPHIAQAQLGMKRKFSRLINAV